MATGGWAHNFPVSKDAHPTYIDYDAPGYDTLIAAMFHDIFTALDDMQDALGYDITGGYATLKAWLDKMGIFDRGDPASPDYDQGDLTLDGDWHDLDLSAFGSAGITAFWLGLRFADVVAAAELVFREKGNTNSINTFVVSTQVAGVAVYANNRVKCNGSRVIQYKSVNMDTPDFGITIIDWEF